MDSIKALKKRAAFISSFIFAAVLFMALFSISVSADENDWWNFRNSDTNNAVTERPAPTSDKEAWEKWAVKLGVDWVAAPTPPIIIDGKLYIGSDNKLFELDRETGAVLRVSEEMPGRVGYAMNTPLYADGKIFIVIERARICAINTSDMSLAWTSDNSDLIKGQTVSPLSYVKIGDTGYVYTGTWTNTDGELICVSTNDEGVEDGIKQLTWKFDPQVDDIENLTENNNTAKGFYWAGAYVNEHYLAIGTDNGSTLGDTVSDVPFYTLNPLTGEIIDAIYGIKGPVRSTVVYNEGCLYFSTKQARIYKIPVTEEGILGEPSYIDLSQFGASSATATPAIYAGKIYLGVSGRGGQFSSDGGHAFCVVRDDTVLSQSSYLYNLTVPGYPQAGALLSNYNEDADFDGDGEPDGRVYLYFTYNAPPGGIFYTYNTPDQTTPTALSVEESKIFVPSKEKQQYCISAVIVDYDGTMYYKNDSGYIFAVEINPAALLEMDIRDNDGNEIVLDSRFQTKIADYTGKAADNVESVTFHLEFAEGASALINGEPYSSSKVFPLSDEQTVFEIVVSKNGKSRTYTVSLNKAGSSAYLSQLASANGNAAPNLSTADVREINPSFDKTITDYEFDWIEVNNKNPNQLMNVFLTTENEGATVKVWPGANCLTKDNDKGIRQFNDDGSIKSYAPSNKLVYKYRFPLYPIDPSRDVQATVEVTSEDKTNTETYYLKFNRRVYVSDLWLDHETAAIQIGDGLELTAQINPENATDKTVKWTTSDKKIAKIETVDAGDGTIRARVTGVSEGTAIITAAAADDGITAECEVTVLAHMHDEPWEIGKAEAVEATCEEAGNIEYWTCSVCGGRFADESGLTGLSEEEIIIPARGHSTEKIEAKEADCTEAGNIEYWICSVCGKMFEDEAARSGISAEEAFIEPLGHDWSEWVINNEPTCLEAGSQTRTCGRDSGHIETEAIPALGHDWGEWTIVSEATCEEDGEQTGVCLRDNTHVRTQSIPATGHDWDEGVEEISETCPEAVVIKYTCRNDPEHTKIIASGSEGHTWASEKTIDKEATCTNDGQMSLHCELCGAIDPESIEVIPASGHDPVKTDAKDSTCTEDGNIEYFTCSHCGKIFADADCTQELFEEDIIVKAAGHELIKTESKEAACEEKGNIEYYTCSNCGKLFADGAAETEITEEDTVIPAKGHAYGSWTYLNKSSHKRICTNDPSHSETADHSWNKGTVTKKATYTAAGEKLYTCKICGGTKTEIIPKLERTQIEEAVLKYASRPYTGKARTQTKNITVTAGGKTLTYKTDYTVSYSNNVNVGTATVKITGTGAYKGTITKTFKITAVKIESAVLAGTKYVYSGKAKKPAATVQATVDGTLTTLAKGTDYTITYADNVNPGKATVTIKGIGNFKGTRTRTFTILPKGTSLKSLTAGKSKLTVNWYKQADQISGYQIQYSRSSGFKSGNTIKTITLPENTSKSITGLTSGKTYYVRIRTYKKSDGNTYYSSWSKKMSVKVN